MMDDLTSGCVAETRDMLERVGDALLLWETALLRRVAARRDFSLRSHRKGQRGAIGLPRIEALAHAAGTALADVHARGRKADAALFGAMLTIIDRVAILVATLVSPDTDCHFAAPRSRCRKSSGGIEHDSRGHNDQTPSRMTSAKRLSRWSIGGTRDTSACAGNGALAAACCGRFLRTHWGKAGWGQGKGFGRYLVFEGGVRRLRFNHLFVRSNVDRDSVLSNKES